MPRFSLVLVLFWLSACGRISNGLDQAVLDCGEDIKPFAGSRFIFPEAHAGLDSDGWQGIGETAEGFKKLVKSSRGCLVVDASVQGPIFLRHQAQDFGVSVATQAWTGNSVHKLLASESPNGLSAESLSLSCGAKLSNNFAAAYQLQRQASPQLHLYQLNYEILTEKDEQVLSSGSSLLGIETNIVLPRVLNEGHYRIRYRLYDVFEDLFAAVQATPVECPLQIDTQRPQVAGFSEVLPLIESNTFQEVSPGQALNFKIEDGSATQLFVCLYANASPPCQNYSHLSGPLYAPEEGAWIVRYYAEDAAGNRTPPTDLLPMAVIHRDVMQSIDSLLSLARLENARGQSIAANKHLLEAYSAYYGLKLPMEKAPLATQLGLSYSEVTRSQRVVAELRDHGQAINKIEWLEGSSPARDALASLDKSADLIVREASGRLLSKLAGVSDFAVSKRFGTIILFSDGTYKLGLRAPRLQLPFGLRPLKLSLKDDKLLVAGNGTLALFQITAQLQLLWQQKGLVAPLELAIAAQENLAVLASEAGIRSFDLNTGRELARQQWDPRCVTSKVVEAPGYGWFIALKSAPDVEAVEEFHCELQNWDGRGTARRVDHVKVLNPNDPFHKPASYRFEEVTQLVYSPQKQWLAFGRNLGPSFVVFDLKTQTAGVYENLGDPEQSLGEITAMAFSADGQYFAVSQSSTLEAQLWKLGPEAGLEALPWQTPLAHIKEQAREVLAMLIDPRHGWLITADEGRLLSIYNYEKTLLPQFNSTLLPGIALTTETGADIVRVDAQKIERLDPYGRLLKTYPLPSPELFAVYTAHDDGLLALDRQGRLWQTIDSGLWTLAYQSDLAATLFLPSPSRRKLLLAGRQATGAGISLILDWDPSTGTWQRTAELPIAGELAVWNSPETHLSLLTEDSCSLWTSQGQKLLELKGEGILNNEIYQAFSSDGQHWLARIDQTLHFWDISQGKALAPPLNWPHGLGFVSFAGERNDRIWLVASSSGRGQSVSEIDFQGRIQRDYGDFEGSLRVIFEREGEPWAIDSLGRVFKLQQAPQVPAALISIKDSLGENLLSLHQPQNFLLTQTADQSFGVLYLREDPRQLQQLCRWLAPMLTAEAGPHRRLCQNLRESAEPGP